MFVQSLQNYFITSTFMQFGAFVILSSSFDEDLAFVDLFQDNFYLDLPSIEV